MKTFPGILRLDESDYNALSDEARRKGVSRSALLRTFLQNGLTRCDVKHEELLRLADRLEATLMDVLELSGVASGLLIKMDVPKFDENVKINARWLRVLELRKE